MSGILAVIGVTMTKIAEGVMLAATVYLASKGVNVKNE